jgi:hypothetical protein
MASDESPDHRQLVDLSSPDRFVGNVKSAFGARWRTVLAEGIRAVPNFDQFLLTELRHSGRQYVCACLTLADARRLSSEERIALMNAMVHEKRGDLIGRLCDGFTWRDAGLKALAKLNTTECRRADYVRLGGYLRQPTTAKVLAHAEYLSPAILRAIWELPDWICLSNLLPILEEPDAVATIKATFKTHLWYLSPVSSNSTPLRHSVWHVSLHYGEATKSARGARITRGGGIGDCPRPRKMPIQHDLSL